MRQAGNLGRKSVNFLTPDQLASMLGLSRKVIIDRYAKQPGFPQPVTSWRKPVWLEDEVRKFMRRKSAQKANIGPSS